MAKRKSKETTKEVAKFGGVDNLGTVKTDLHSPFKEQNYDASAVEAQSQTKLEDDLGEGNAVVIRSFTFQMNLEKPELFIERAPSKQEIFNSHIGGIEMALWKDGLKVYDEVAPRMTFDVQKLQYTIFVPAVPRNGYLLQQKPQTLTEIAHG